jgi:peptide chain release factor subunit 1
MALFSYDGTTYQVEPPQAITSFRYICGAEFWLDPLRAMTEETTLIGLLVMDNEEATIGLLRGTVIEVLETLRSGIGNKHGNGGMSQNRFLHLHEEMTRFFQKEVADAANARWLAYDRLSGILIGGPGQSKEAFVAADLLDYRYRDKILAAHDTGYTDYQGMKELLAKSEEVLRETGYMRQKHALGQFMEGISLQRNTIAYGKADVAEALRCGKVATLLISEDKLDDLQTEWHADLDHYKPAILAISPESEEGATFHTTFGGIGALLYYA